MQPAFLRIWRVGIDRSTDSAALHQHFNRQIPNFTHEWLLSGRVDWNIGSKDQSFHARWLRPRSAGDVTRNVISPLFNAQSDQPQWQGQFSETHIFSSTLVNQFIVSGAWYSAIFTNRIARHRWRLSDGGIWLDGVVQAIGHAMYDWPQGRNVTQYQIADDLSKTLGNHTIKGRTEVPAQRCERS